MKSSHGMLATLPGSIPGFPSLLGRSVLGHSIPPIRNVIKHVSFGTNNFKRDPENTKSTVASNRFPKKKNNIAWQHL